MNEVEATIRPFAAGDRDMVNEFFDQMGPETTFFFNSTDYNRNYALKFWDDLETAKDNRYFAATEPTADGGELMVGYVYLCDMGKKVPWLGIAVRDGYKGKHMGKRLIQQAIDCAKAENCGGILLTTHFANTRGQGLYQKMGFEKLGQHTCGSEFLYLLRLPQE